MGEHVDLFYAMPIMWTAMKVRRDAELLHCVPMTSSTSWANIFLRTFIGGNRLRSRFACRRVRSLPTRRRLEIPVYCWVEIGPGHGEMTEYLAGTGAPVHAIEVDQILIGNLNRLKRKIRTLM